VSHGSCTTRPGFSRPESYATLEEAVSKGAELRLPRWHPWQRRAALLAAAAAGSLLRAHASARGPRAQLLPGSEALRRMARAGGGRNASAGGQGQALEGTQGWGSWLHGVLDERGSAIRMWEPHGSRTGPGAQQASQRARLDAESIAELVRCQLCLARSPRHRWSKHDI
jgi:hypothetical protein